MRVKHVIWGLTPVLFLLAGCQATPEEDVIVQKAEQEEKLTQAAEIEEEDIGKSLRELLEAPETVSFQVASSDGRQTYAAENAAVNVPETDKASTASALRRDFTDEDTRIWQEAFFGDAEVWKTEPYVTTKDEWLQMIHEMTKSMEAERESVDTEYLADWEEGFQRELDWMTEEMEKAPETAPAPKHETPEYQLLPDPNYKQEEGYYHTFSIDGVLDGVNCTLFLSNADWGTFGSFYKPVEQYGLSGDSWIDQGLEIPNACKYSEEQAAALVKELLEKLEPGNNLVLKTATPLYYPEEGEYGDAGQKEDGETGQQAEAVESPPKEWIGYELRFVREVNGLMENTTWYSGTDDEGAEEGYIPFGYETVDATVTDEGIISFFWQDRMAQGEILQENVALLPFARIQEIIETQLPMIHAGWEVDENYRVMSIDLGLMCMRKANDNDSFTMVPVWDVYCGWLDESGDFSGVDVDTNLTIHAVDGSIINRGLRY